MMVRLKNCSSDGLGRDLFFLFALVLQWCYLTTQGSPYVSVRCFLWVLVFASLLPLWLSVDPVVVRGWAGGPRVRIVV